MKTTLPFFFLHLDASDNANDFVSLAEDSTLAIRLIIVARRNHDSVHVFSLIRTPLLMRKSSSTISTYLLI